MKPISKTRRVLNRLHSNVCLAFGLDSIFVGGLLFSLMVLIAPSTVFASHSVTDAPVIFTCEQTSQLDHPHVFLKSHNFRAIIFPPDSERGYYRASRFDWSGVIGCAVYKGHSYWGQWFGQYDPMVNDSITGPVEEFRSPEGGQGYNTAKPGGLFVKIGVGVLRKVSDTPYQFGYTYPLVDSGTWIVKSNSRNVRFEQMLSSPTGVRYRYVKRLSVSRDGSQLTLHHTLTNMGENPIVTDVYDHDFFMLDGRPTGPGFSVNPGFAPVLQDSLAPYAMLKNGAIVYQQALPSHGSAATYITGFDPDASGYRIRVEDTVSQTGVEQTADRPMEKFYLWSIRTTVAPEAYIHLAIQPGKSESWTIRYKLFAGALPPQTP
jgi:hypothetical protein